MITVKCSVESCDGFCRGDHFLCFKHWKKVPQPTKELYFQHKGTELEQFVKTIAVAQIDYLNYSISCTVRDSIIEQAMAKIKNFSGE